MLMGSQLWQHLIAWHHLASFHWVANVICWSSAPSRHYLLLRECLQAHWTPSYFTSSCMIVTCTLSTLVFLENGTPFWSKLLLIGSILVPEVTWLPFNHTLWYSETHRSKSSYFSLRFFLTILYCRLYVCMIKIRNTMMLSLVRWFTMPSLAVKDRKSVV